MSPGTVDVTRGLQRHHRHRPHRHHAARPRASACRSPGRPTPAVASGQFSLWVVSSTYSGWYVGKIHAAADTAPPSYADAVDLERARRHRLPRLRLLPRHQRRPLGPLRHQPGDGRRDGAVFSAITVTAPIGTSSQAQGSALPVTWTTNAAVASGQFSLWVVSSANGWYVGKIVAAERHGELRRRGRP